MLAFVGLVLVALAVFSGLTGVTQLLRWQDPIRRDDDPDSFRLVVGGQFVIGLVLVAIWLISHYHGPHAA